MPTSLLLVDAAPDAVLAALVAEHEALTGVALATGDPERLLLQSVAPEVARLRSVLDAAFGQDLLEYTTGAHLEALVALVGVARRPETAGTGRVRFLRDEALVGDDGRSPAVVIPEGTAVEAFGTGPFPTRVGMIPSARRPGPGRGLFPHSRGMTPA